MQYFSFIFVDFEQNVLPLQPFVHNPSKQFNYDKRRRRAQGGTQAHSQW